MSNIEDHIRRAIEEGKFDDLPGKGKPLKLEDDPFVDPEWRLAHHMLRSSGFTLPWIERRQEIEQLLDDAKEALKRSWVWRQNVLTRLAADAGKATHAGPATDHATIQAEWGKAVGLFLDRVRVINQEIRSYNLEVPSERFQIRAVDGQHELDLISSEASGTLQDTSPGL